MTIEILQSGRYETVIDKAAGQWGLWSYAASRFLRFMHNWTDTESGAISLLPEESERKP